MLCYRQTKLPRMAITGRCRYCALATSSAAGRGCILQPRSCAACRTHCRRSRTHRGRTPECVAREKSALHGTLYTMCVRRVDLHSARDGATGAAGQSRRMEEEESASKGWSMEAIIASPQYRHSRAMMSSS